jgi:hypothetical protein
MEDAESSKPEGIPSKTAVRALPWDSPDVRNLSILNKKLLFSIPIRLTI